MSKLNPVAQKWVKALRSGKYKQGKDKLRNGDKFCCLGVLCELAARAGVIDKFDAEFGEYDGHDTYLPEQVREWAGLKTYSGELTRGEYGSLAVASLAVANDEGKSFKTIAKIIEKHADELFEPESA